MEASTTIMTFHCQRAGFVLHSEITANRARSVTNETVGLRKSAAGYEIVEKIVQSFLMAVG